MKLLISALVLLTSISGFAEITRPLPQGDSLAKVAEFVGSQFADGNISTGTTSLKAGLLIKSVGVKSEEKFRSILKLGFEQAFQNQTDEAIAQDAQYHITVSHFTDNDVSKMTAAVLESNDFNTSNVELRESQARYIWSVLRKMPVTNKTLIGHVKTRLKDENSGEMRSIQYFLLLNTDKKAVELFTIEGSM